MAIYTNLPVYKDTYSLLLNLCMLMPRLPRDSRYTIGQELRKTVMEIILLIYRANRVRSKCAIISQMRESMLQAQVYVRLLCDMRQISEKKYAELLDQSSSISRQLSAWEKSEISKQNNGETRNLQPE